ncbi:MAG: tyrosine-type recombinase/integrase [Bradymonadia bacterium]
MSKDTPTTGLAQAEQRARAYRARAAAPNTRGSYHYAWEQWLNWAVDHDVRSLPADPHHVLLYLTELADDLGLKPSTLTHRLAAIRERHAREGLPRPESAELAQVLKGIRREAGRRGQGATRRAAANVLEDLAALLACVPAPKSAIDAKPLRDRCLLSLMWAGALRTSDLIALQLEDRVWHPRGVVLRIRVSKGDQEGRGQQVAIPRAKNQTLCAVAHLEAWEDFLAEQQITTGPIVRGVTRHGTLRSPRPGHIPRGMTRQAVHELLKRYYADAQLDESQGPRTTHSMRAGRITQAFEDGASLEEIIQMSRHKNPSTALIYRRHADPFAGIPSID